MPDKDLVLEFASFHEVLDNYTRRLSEEGIFFETSAPHGEGVEVDFHVRIREGFSVLKGRGEVVQSTDEGLFVRLIYLDQPSLKLLPKLLEYYRRKGVPLMDLPRLETVEAQAVEQVQGEVDGIQLESRQNTDGDGAEKIEIGESPDVGLTAEDLFDSEATTPGPIDDVVLTLDDLEAEFRAEAPGSDPAAEVEVDFDVDLDAGTTEAEPGPVLIEAEELAEHSRDEALLVAEVIEPEIEVLGTGRDLEVDAGLPWLPDESDKNGKRDLWVILLLVLLGAVLGAAFYVFVMRPTAQRSWKSVPEVPVQGQAVPATDSRVEVLPTSSQTVTPAPLEKPDPVAESNVALEYQEPVPDSEAPLTGVDRITWDDEAGETVVTLWADGSFLAEQVDDFRINGEQPREVVRIRGVQRPFAQHLIELGTDHVRQIRTGFHQKDGVNSLHIVADLVDIDVELLRTEAAGEQLRVYFSKTG